MRIRLTIAACLALTFGSAYAANLGFLGNAPISRMTAEDVDLLYAAAVEVLENYADGDGRAWENPATDAGGSLRVIDSYAGPAGERCRHLRVNNHAAGLRNQTVVALCRQPDGKWKLHAD
jgi:surface antigen